MSSRQSVESRQGRPFSPEARAENLERLSKSGAGLDMLVIGGGITGAGIARDAVLRGLRVGLVERRDFAAGTSSRSSKMIHGGVRYLQLGDFALVRESAKERQILGKIAPHIVRPILMVVLAHSRRAQLKLNVGLWTYDRIGNIDESERFTTWSREQAIERIPRVRTEKLRGGVAYYESVADDARLVLDTLKDAHAGGALIVNHAEVTQLHDDGGRITGVRARDAVTGKDYDMAARLVINAAGPWVDAVRRLEGPLPPKQLHLTKGIHVTLPRACLPLEHIVAFTANDRRTVFVVPKGEVVYVGTTDTDYGQPTDQPEITAEDVDYLLSAVRRTFDAPEMSSANLASAWSGLRPLLHEDGKAPSEISRKDEILVGAKGLISIAGGKLTTYRRMAKRIVDLAIERLGAKDRVGRARTHRLPLPGGDCSPADLERLAKRLQAERPDVPPQAVARIVDTYGTQAETVLAAIDDHPELASPLDAGSTLIGADLRYAVEHEMALGIEDFLERRTRSLLFAPDQGLGVVEAVAEGLQARLGWSDERKKTEAAAYRGLAARLRDGHEPQPEAGPDLAAVAAGSRSPRRLR